MRSLPTFKFAVAGALGSLYGVVIASITIIQQAQLPRGAPAREADLASTVADPKINGLLQAADKASHACLGAFFDSLQITMGLAVRMLIVSGLAMSIFLFIAVSERSKAAI